MTAENIGDSRRGIVGIETGRHHERRSVRPELAAIVEGIGPVLRDESPDLQISETIENREKLYARPFIEPLGAVPEGYETHGVLIHGPDLRRKQIPALGETEKQDHRLDRQGRRTFAVRQVLQSRHKKIGDDEQAYKYLTDAQLDRSCNGITGYPTYTCSRSSLPDVKLKSGSKNMH